MATSAVAGAGALGLSIPAAADKHGDNGDNDDNGESIEMTDEENELDDIDITGEPIEELEFDFDTVTEDPVEFLQTAAFLEDGYWRIRWCRTIDQDCRPTPAGLSIHSLEARYTSFLNVLNGEIGFPDAFNEAFTVDKVLERAGPFIVEYSVRDGGFHFSTN